jgi:3-keto-L-gulonate-6-phosphate decarboxylase
MWLPPCVNASPAIPSSAEAFKVCDGARYFAKIAHAAGATHFDVMAASHDATLRAAGDAARELGLVAIPISCFVLTRWQLVRAESLGYR